MARTKWQNKYIDNQDNTTLVELYNQGDLRGVMLIDTSMVAQCNQHIWRVGSDGYALYTVSLWDTSTVAKPGQPIEFHRYFFPAQKPLMVDHINRNRLDNRMCNLRHVTASQSVRNREKIDKYWEKRKATWDQPPKKRPYGSGCVSWNKSCNKWQASLRGKEYLGVYQTKQQAERAITDAVYNHRRYKIKGHYSKEDLVLIHNLNLTDTEVAKKLNRTTKAIAIKRWKLGLKPLKTLKPTT